MDLSSRSPCPFSNEPNGFVDLKSSLNKTK